MQEQTQRPLTPDFALDAERREAELAAKVIRYVRPDGATVEFFLTTDQRNWVEHVVQKRLNRANATFQRRLEAVIQQLEELCDREPLDERKPN